MSQHFQHMSPESSRCYTKCINEILLNIYAVQQGYFDQHLKDIYTLEDRKVWKMVLPTMIALMERKLANAKPNSNS